MANSKQAANVVGRVGKLVTSSSSTSLLSNTGKKIAIGNRGYSLDSQSMYEAHMYYGSSGGNGSNKWYEEGYNNGFNQGHKEGKESVNVKFRSTPAYKKSAKDTYKKLNEQNKVKKEEVASRLNRSDCACKYRPWLEEQADTGISLDTNKGDPNTAYIRELGREDTIDRYRENTFPSAVMRNVKCKKCPPKETGCIIG